MELHQKFQKHNHNNDFFQMEQKYYTIRMILLLAARDAFLLEKTFNLPEYHVITKLDNMLALLLDSTKEICLGILDRHNKAKASKCESIIQYLLNNYHDPSLSAQSIAEKFGYSEKYLFKYFKEQTGMSHISYLNQIRMERAVELLETSTFTTQQISEKVGYINYDTFLKAFKREFNMTPGQFKKSLII